LKVIKIDWTKTNKDFVFCPIGDTHIGSKDVNYNFIQQVIKEIKQRNYYVLGMGDYLQFETKNSVGDKFECCMTNVEAIDYFIKTFKNVNLIGLLTGNHDGGRSLKEVSVDIVELLANMLNTEYLGEFVVLVISMKYISYTICAWHGCGSCSTDMGVYKKMLKVVENKFYDADLYLQGHYHRLKEFPEKVLFVLNRNKTKLIKKVQKFLDTGSFQWYSRYVDRLNLQPVQLGHWVIRLKNGKRKQIILRKKIEGGEFFDYNMGLS